MNFTIHFKYAKDSSGNSGVFIPENDWNKLEMLYPVKNLNDKNVENEEDDNDQDTIAGIIENTRKLRRRKLLHGHPFMINTTDLPKGQFYFEWPNGDITLNSLNENMDGFIKLAVLSREEQIKIMQELELDNPFLNFGVDYKKEPCLDWEQQFVKAGALNDPDVIEDIQTEFEKNEWTWE